MSIEGVTNYEYMNRYQQRTGWEKLENIDYCEQELRRDPEGLMHRIAAFFRKLF